jgi:hypothetical protein
MIPENSFIFTYLTSSEPQTAGAQESSEFWGNAVQEVADAARCDTQLACDRRHTHQLAEPHDQNPAVAFGQSAGELIYSEVKQLDLLYLLKLGLRTQFVLEELRGKLTGQRTLAMSGAPSNVAPRLARYDRADPSFKRPVIRIDTKVGQASEHLDPNVLPQVIDCLTRRSRTPNQPVDERRALSEKRITGAALRQRRLPLVLPRQKTRDEHQHVLVDHDSTHGGEHVYG